MKTALNNVVLPTLFKVVNNTKQVVEPETNLQSGVTMLNNIADNLEQCGLQNIVQCCFHHVGTISWSPSRKPLAFYFFMSARLTPFFPESL